MIANSSQIYQKQYEDEGYAIFRQVLDKSTLSLINQHLDSLCEKQSSLERPNLFATPIKDDLFWSSLVADKRLLDIAELFIGSDIALFGANYVVKWVGDAKPVLWHQDAPNWRLEPLEAVTLWIAIDDSNTANGCLKFISGSHKAELYELQPANDTPNIFGWQTDPKLVQEEKAIEIVLKAGDISVHHPKLIHGSGANNSTQRRAAMSIRYIPTNTRIVNNASQFNNMVLRGKLHPNTN